MNATHAGTVTGTLPGTLPGTVPATPTGTQDSEFALPQPLPTTPTPSTSSRTDALGRGRADEKRIIARLRDIHPLDALAVTAALLRPDWNLAAIRGILARTHGSHDELAERVLRVCLDPDARTPGALENAGAIVRRETPQAYPTVAEALAANEADALDDHGFPPGRCPFCRHGIAPVDGAQ